MCIVFFFFKQKTAYEMRISDWSSDVCSSDLASALPFALQLVTGFLVLELGVYLWHRTMHNSEPLWRAMHQMHHSAERVDIWGAFYFHPLDMVGWVFPGSLCLVGISGDRKSVESGTSGSVSVHLGGRGHINKKTTIKQTKLQQ